MAENESLWREENSGESINNIGAGTEMRSAGVTPSGIQSDLDDLGTTEPGEGAPEPEVDTATPDTTTPGGGGETI